jgi:hypothetical protein
MKSKIALISGLLTISHMSYAAIDMYSVNVPADARPSAPSAMMMQAVKEQKEKGYIERTSLKYNYLANIEKRAKFATKADIKDLELVNNPSELLIVPNLKTVPSSAKASTIGYATIGTFLKDAGWTGITEVFKSGIGVCQFSHSDLKASNGGYSLSEKDERRDVNDKYTYVEIEGKVNYGFSYEVGWFDELNMYTLSCVNKEFSKEFTDKVIELARQIDKG